MTRWKLTIEYDGFGFCGWQRQTTGVSVQQTLEEAIEKFSGESVTLGVAGRTDAGVHALGQVAHVDLERETDADEIMGALNFHVRPHRVGIVRVERVAPDFNARLDARERTYRYLIATRRPPLVLNAGRAWHHPASLSVEPMREAATLLLGNHDFSTFRASHCQAKSPIKTLDALDIERQGDLVSFTVKARSFLYHQVRNMVGTLALVGTGRWTVAQFADAFKAADRAQGGPTAPPEGLYFWSVAYPKNQDSMDPTTA